MTSFQVVYDAFLAKISTDEWVNSGMTEEQIQEDWRAMLESAIMNFKFSRIGLDRGETSFNNELTSQEIQVLSVFMKKEWLSRTILCWQNIRATYEERDFSQANMLDKLVKLYEQVEQDAKDIENLYYRSVAGRPFDFTSLAGK